MSELEAPDQEPATADGGGQALAAKARRSFSKLRRELTDEEVSSPAVQRLLLDELDRLEKEVVEHAHFRERYHASDKKASVLEEKLKHWQAAEAAHVLCLTAGSALIGYAPSVWNHPPTGYIALSVGAVLVIGAVLAKVRAR